MTSDERTLLERMTPAADADPRDELPADIRLATAIRAALAEVDALTQQVATLTTERDEAHRLAVESKRKMDAAYAHADLIQSEMPTATDDCPHPSDTWTTRSACHLKVMRERDAACAQVADLEHADECHAKFYARLCDALHVPEQHAVDGDVFDAIADLEARAIPKELIEPAMRPDSIDTFYVYLEPDDSEREADRTIMFVCNGRIVTQGYNAVVDYPTVGDAMKALSAALIAAKEAP